MSYIPCNHFFPAHCVILCPPGIASSSLLQAPCHPLSSRHWVILVLPRTVQSSILEVLYKVLCPIYRVIISFPRTVSSSILQALHSPLSRHNVIFSPLCTASSSFLHVLRHSLFSWHCVILSSPCTVILSSPGTASSSLFHVLRYPLSSTYCFILSPPATASSSFLHVLCYPLSSRHCIILSPPVTASSSLLQALYHPEKSLYFTSYPWEKKELISSPLLPLGQTGFFSLGLTISLRKGKFWIQSSCTPHKKLTLCHILPEAVGKEVNICMQYFLFWYPVTIQKKYKCCIVFLVYGTLQIFQNNVRFSIEISSETQILFLNVALICLINYFFFSSCFDVNTLQKNIIQCDSFSNES